MGPPLFFVILFRITLCFKSNSAAVSDQVEWQLTYIIEYNLFSICLYIYSRPYKKNKVRKSKHDLSGLKEQSYNEGLWFIWREKEIFI